MGKFKTAYENIKIAIKNRAEEKRQERIEIKEATKEIRKKAIEAGLKEKETQAIKYAKEKQKVFADRKIKALSQPRQPLFNLQPTQQPKQNQPPQESFGDFIMKM